MSQVQGDRSDAATVQKIMHAPRSCYGRLDDPTFRKVSAKLASRPSKNLISEDAPTRLSAFIAKAVQDAGLLLPARSTVAHKISMQRADGSAEAPFYQALFTDTDRIP
jgi:hypothetical protein